MMVDELEEIKREIIRILEHIDNDKDRKLFLSSLPRKVESEIPKIISDYRPPIKKQENRDLPEIKILLPRE